MPALRPRRRTARPQPAARIVVLGDLMLDVVLASQGPLQLGTDVPGSVALVQGGSAANTARWLGRLGAQVTLIARRGPGRGGSRARRGGGIGSGRGPCVAGRGSADGPHRGHRRAERRALVRRRSRRGRLSCGRTTSTRRGFDASTRSTCRCTRCSASRSGVRGRSGGRARAGGRRRRHPSISRRSGRSSVMAGGSPASSSARRRPTCFFATAAEAEALLGRAGVEGLLDFAPVVVVKRGSRGGDRDGPARRPSRAPVRSGHGTADRHGHDGRRATPSMPASSSAGSVPAPRARPCLPRCAAPRWPVIAPRPASSARAAPSCRLADAARRRLHDLGAPGGCARGRRWRCATGDPSSRSNPR